MDMTTYVSLLVPQHLYMRTLQFLAEADGHLEDEQELVAENQRLRGLVVTLQEQVQDLLEHGRIVETEAS